MSHGKIMDGREVLEVDRREIFDSQLITSANLFKSKMAGRNPLLSPSPPCSLDVLVFPIHSLVAQWGFEFFAQAIINVITLFPKHYAEIG